ncbi:MAG TPA: hypothetical protein VN151_00680, partial [Terracidiphilus sp.]|nr:hypothetical protein [Terracidiphilus sp.]
AETGTRCNQFAEFISAKAVDVSTALEEPTVQVIAKPMPVWDRDEEPAAGLKDSNDFVERAM